VRFIRPFITAITALALTAAVAIAHQMPAASVDGLATAAAAAGKIVPVGHVTVDENGDQQDELTAEQTTEDEQTDEADQTDETNASEGDRHCIAPETEDTTEDTDTEDTDTEGTDTEGTETEDTTATDEQTNESQPNHGAIVCGAAQAETPDGYANHGAYVREFAQDNAGAQKSAAAKAKHSSGEVTTSNVTKHGKGHGHTR
jgi:hypothetical protein